jgi:nuclear factor of activated T-cells 5
MLEMPSKVDVNSNSNDAILNGNSNRSPRAQDIILNSQAAVLNGTNSLSVMLSGSPQSQHNMSPEIILNPAVSPTMMCQANTDPTSLLTNSMLNGISIPQATQEAILNNLIPTSLGPQPEPIHISHKTPVAVKNMYLNAANHILTTQPTQSTLNALISMDQSMMNNQVQAQVTPMIIGGQSNVTNENSTMQNLSIYHPNEHDNIHHQIIGSNQLQERQNVLAEISLINHVNEQQMQTNDNNAFMHVNDNSLQAIQNLNQESHLQNLSLARSILNDDQKMNPQNVVSTSTATASIPQELTTMSDHDLISYINPSCFDQM